MFMSRRFIAFGYISPGLQLKHQQFSIRAHGIWMESKHEFLREDVYSKLLLTQPGLALSNHIVTCNREALKDVQNPEGPGTRPKCHHTTST